MKYQGVDTDHPRIVEAIKNLAKLGRNKEDIQEIVGMPREIVDKYVNEFHRENKS
jgi:hypothetical protein